MDNAKFWLPKNRFYELRYFTLQYPYYQRVVANPKSSETMKTQAKIAIYKIDQSLMQVNCDYMYLLEMAVTTNATYEDLMENNSLIPESKKPSKDEFMEWFRQFFYFLSKNKGI